MKELKCIQCCKHMGEISKGKLKKELRFICKPCLNDLLISEDMKSDHMDKFSKIFGDKYR